MTGGSVKSPRRGGRGGSMVDRLPNLGREQEMLADMGMSSMDDLFSDIPEDVRRTEPLDLRIRKLKKKSYERLECCWGPMYRWIVDLPSSSRLVQQFRSNNGSHAGNSW